MLFERVFSQEANGPYQASRLHAVYILIACWSVTFFYCFKAIFVSLTSAKPRVAADKVIYDWSKALLKVVKLNVNTVGSFPEHTGRPVVIMCTHASTFDIPVSFVALPGTIRMLAKKELFRIPILGQAMRMLEFISLDRHNKEQARNDLEAAKKLMSSGVQVWIAPEGTRSRDGNLLPLKKGGMHLAIQTEALIVPVAINNIIDVMPVGTFKFMLNKTVEVNVGEPIDAASFDSETRNQLTEQVEHSLRGLLQ